MKRLFTLSYIILIVILFIQCDGASKKSVQKDIDIQSEIAESGIVHITGFIKNRNKYPDTKDMRLELPDISGSYFRILTPIDENGEFHFEFELNQAQDVRLPPYLDFLYVYPNDSLHVELDFEDLTKVNLSGGKGVKTNSDFKNYFGHTFYRNSDYYIGTDPERDLSIEELRKILDDKKSLCYQRRNDFLKTTQIDKDVLFLTESMIELDYYSYLIRLYLMRDHKNLVALKDELEKKTTVYFSKGLYSDSHFNFIEKLFSLNTIITPPDKNSPSSYMQQLHFPNDTIKYFALARYASTALKMKDLASFEEFYSQINNTYFNSRLMKEYQITLEKMNNPEAISAAITGQSTDMQSDMLSKGNMLQEIIANHEGKVLVIDIWATWCPPCIGEFPRYRTLIDDYKDKDVAFSFICTPGDELKSNEILKMFQLSDVPNRFCTEEEYRFLSKTFSPISFPYGILVNKKGVIVDYGSHVRPKMIRKKLDILLEQDKLVD